MNVPTPIVAGEHLIVSTGNNGTRAYRFDAQGAIVPESVAVNEGLAPHTHNPVAIGGRLLGIWSGLHCLDIAAGLKPIWQSELRPFFLDFPGFAGGAEISAKILANR